MVRKNAEDTQETFNALLDAAETVFSEKGVTRATLNEIAIAAGMTRGAIYWHFKDKKELFQAMCHRAFLPMEILLQEITEANINDPLASLRLLCIHMLKHVAISPRQTVIFNIIFHRCEKTDDLYDVTKEDENRDQCLNNVEDILKAAVKQGVLPVNTDTAIAMQVIHSSLMGIIHEWLVNTNAYDLTKHAESMIDMLLAGLVAKPPLKS